MMLRFRLCEADRERYGGPEWLDFDLGRAVDLETGLLESVEDATGYTILRTLPEALDRGELKAIRAALWLARHIAGIHEPPFSMFTPNLLRAESEMVPAADADPPVSTNRAARRASARTKRTAPASAT